jgi:hypothetical protein
MFLLQTVAFTILVTNLRAISHLQYTIAALTEIAFLSIQWTLIRKIVSADSWPEQAGYMFGGACGTLLSMWMTRMWV